MSSNKSTYSEVDGKYGSITVFAHDTGAVTRSLLAYGEWAENELSFLKHFVPEGSTVLDVGAYIGTHTLAFSSYVGQSGQVIAFEAQPDTFSLLERNLAGTKQAELRNAVVSYEAGQISIPTIDANKDNSFGSTSLLQVIVDQNAEVSPDQEATVPAVTIDSLDLQNCALIKADVEGVEHLVLSGATKTLARCSPVVYCECNALTQGLKSVEVLRLAHYKIFAHVVNAFNESNFFHTGENIFGDAREVAIVGIPADKEQLIRQQPVRPCELLLEITDADDLALALLNKPQYQMEVLSESNAARTGGSRFLNESVSTRLELERMQNEAAELQRLRVEEERAYQERLRNASSGELEIAELHEHLKQRDMHIAQFQDDIVRLKQSAANSSAEMVQLHEYLRERDAQITKFQSETTQLSQRVANRDTQIAQLREYLVERDNAIIEFRNKASELSAEISQLHGYVGERDTHILRFQEEISRQKDRIIQLGGDIANLENSLNRRNVEVTNLKFELTLKDSEVAKKEIDINQRDREIAEHWSYRRECDATIQRLLQQNNVVPDALNGRRRQQQNQAGGPPSQAST